MRCALGEIAESRTLVVGRGRSARRCYGALAFPARSGSDCGTVERPPPALAVCWRPVEATLSRNTVNYVKPKGVERLPRPQRRAPARCGNTGRADPPRRPREPSRWRAPSSRSTAWTAWSRGASRAVSRAGCRGPRLSPRSSHQAAISGIMCGGEVHAATGREHP